MTEQMIVAPEGSTVILISDRPLSQAQAWQAQAVASARHDGPVIVLDGGWSVVVAPQGTTMAIAPEPEPEPEPVRHELFPGMQDALDALTIRPQASRSPVDETRPRAEADASPTEWTPPAPKHNPNAHLEWWDNEGNHHVKGAQG